MDVSLLYLGLSVYGAAYTANALRPVRFPLTVVPAFFASWLTAELAPQHIAWQLVATIGFVWASALDAWTGWLGLGITLASWAGLAVLTLESTRVGRAVEAGLEEGLGADFEERTEREAKAPGSRVPLRRLAFPFWFRRRDVERIRSVPYGPRRRRNLLDVYRPAGAPSGCPTLVWVHGGGWVIGNKNQQALPMLNDLASKGWVCFTINYRLGPRARFPSHVVDVKAALAWVREHGEEYGADPRFILLTGGSAGGHLAALAALTPGDPEFQPGFEDADTRVQACVPFYGVYDVTDRHGYRGRFGGPGFVRFLERAVMPSKLEDDPDAWRRASPLDRIRSDAPPFCVVHGTLDLLAPVEEAREFARALREVSESPVAYLELARTQHAFDVFHSIRTGQVVEGVERFGAWAYATWLEQQGEGVVPAAQVEAEDRHRRTG